MTMWAESRQVVGAAIVVLVAGLAGGCKPDPSAQAVRMEIERQLPGIRLEKEAHIRLGRISFALVRGLASLALDEDDGERRILREIKRVEVATWEVVEPPTAVLTPVPSFERQLRRYGWTLAVRQRDDSDNTWVFFHEDGAEAVRGMYVVTLDPDELTVVRLDGRLDRVVAEALADDPDGLVDSVSG